jgi:Spy/CpxP family protein refolding chaperone
MKRNAFIVSLAIFSLLIAGDIHSQPAGYGDGMGRGRGPMRRGDGPMCFGSQEQMKEVLKLSDKQIELIGRINKEFRNSMIRLHEKMKPMQLRLKELLLSDSINYDDIRALLIKISVVEVDMRMLRIKQRNEIEKVLTKEQKDRLKSERRMMMHDMK